MEHSIDINAFVQATGDAIIASDGEGVILLWNPAAEQIFGFTADEALGNSLDLIIPERFRTRHWDGYRKTMSTGETKYGHDLLRVPAIHKDGRKLSIAFTVTLLLAADGRVEAIVAVVRDETERWAEEQELRKRVAELQKRWDSTGNTN